MDYDTEATYVVSGFGQNTIASLPGAMKVMDGARNFGKWITFPWNNLKCPTQVALSQPVGVPIAYSTINLTTIGTLFVEIDTSFTFLAFNEIAILKPMATKKCSIVFDFPKEE